MTWAPLCCAPGYDVSHLWDTVSPVATIRRGFVHNERVDGFEFPKPAPAEEMEAIAQVRVSLALQNEGAACVHVCG